MPQELQETTQFSKVLITTPPNMGYLILCVECFGQGDKIRTTEMFYKTASFLHIYSELYS